MYLLYVASSDFFRTRFLFKLGCTEDKSGRLKQYLTGCPPGENLCYDITYDGIWETNAKNREQLLAYEEMFHDKFYNFRLMRRIPGDTEWFDFVNAHNFEKVKAYLNTRPWIKRQVPLFEIIEKESRFLRKRYQKNLENYKKKKERLKLLNQIQLPVIEKIREFVFSSEERAGHLIAPCGSGKTLMACKGFKGLEKVIISCPSHQIQNQWKETLIQEGCFKEEEIEFVSSKGTTDMNKIERIFQRQKFCVITTYNSSYRLINFATGAISLIVFDEVHHMAGKKASGERGEGMTRGLISDAVEKEIKRLSLTYTPRYIRDFSDEYLSMDDTTVFGQKIAELKLREMIRQGILPDYMVWTLRSDEGRDSGVRGKARCLAEAWNAKEFAREKERFVLNHLIIFVLTIADAIEMKEELEKHISQTLILRVGEGSRTTRQDIDAFTEAKRAILVNCFKLGEGVDIPIADSVAIAYPKQSRSQITQMILRAGRWYPGKSLFHFLLPTLGDEELSGFEEVLMALASCDEQIRDEILIRCQREGQAEKGGGAGSNSSEENLPDHIIMENYEGGNLEEVKRCFRNLKNKIFPSTDLRWVQEFCLDHNIDTSHEYKEYRKKRFSDLPKMPVSGLGKWYDFLHPNHKERISAQKFIQEIIEKNPRIRRGMEYDEWRTLNPLDSTGNPLPSVQNITDGFFGSENLNFDELIVKFGVKVSKRRK